MRVHFALWFVLCAACGRPGYGGTSTVSVPPDPAMLGSGMEVELGPTMAQSQPSSWASPAAPAAPVLVTHDKEVGYPTEVVGVLDFHSPAQSEDKGFEELRMRAAALGGDAVIRAEFEHGEDGGPSHLSGMVVRAR